jgi:tetratricopeptide (TPR) repeat protein
LQQAIASFQRAISLDPTYDEAYAGLGDAYVLLSSYGGPEPSKNLSLARENARKALSLNPHLGEAHTVLAAVKVDLDWDWEGAVKEYQAALRFSPNDSTTHHWYALHLSRLGRHKEAEAEIEQAIQLDPVSLIINTDAAEIYYRAGDLDRATVYLDKVGRMNPDFADSHMIRGEVEEQQRNFAGAVREFQLAETLFHKAPNIIALRGHALALAGERKWALDTARELERLAATRYVSGVDIGIVYCGLGDSDTAIKWLQRAYEHHDKGLNILAADPLFLNCRRDPKFSQLLAELHLPTL